MITKAQVADGNAAGLLTGRVPARYWLFQLHSINFATTLALLYQMDLVKYISWIQKDILDLTISDVIIILSILHFMFLSLENFYLFS